jgi:serine protease SohB
MPSRPVREDDAGMPDALVDYLLFLAKTMTVVLALATLLVVAGVASRRGRPRSRLQVRDAGERYDRLSWTLRAQALPKALYKAQVKADKRQRKARQAEARAATEPRRRLFVLDFKGDPMASRVSGLREEVTAILAVATPRDEVVVRLENPGGLVHDQGLAASQLLRVRRRGVPLTAAVDTMAASGGYLMACVATKIVAAPFAVVGSIGVVAQVPNFYRLLDRAGVDVEQFTGGEFKRTVTMFGRNTDADRAKLTEEIADTHALFKEFVAEHRPQVDVEAVGTGEHWYGARALDLGLVDEILTSDDYLLAARRDADIYEVSYAPRPTVRRTLAQAARAAVARPM